MLLALPSGVIADRFDQPLGAAGRAVRDARVSGALAVPAFTDALPPTVPLVLTFLLGCGTALMGPARRAIQPELVEGRRLGQAAALGAVILRSPGT
ncbi:MFS transporter [Streptomyces sp. NPDC088178]|uniref:MFS transporter n=1 Tax=Streptomyces sp. NPDC088178 TaxID=3365836 RepID=UPI00382D7EEA